MVALSGWSGGITFGEPVGVSLKVYKKRFSFEVVAGKSTFLQRETTLDIYINPAFEFNLYSHNNLLFYTGLGVFINMGGEGFGIPGLTVPLGIEGILKGLPLGISINLNPAVVNFKPFLSLNFSVKWHNMITPIRVETVKVVVRNPMYREQNQQKESEKTTYNREKAEYFYKLGLDAYSKGRYEEALEYFQKSYNADPTFEKARVALERTERMLKK